MADKKLPQRTNSLAFSKSDCHTCKSRGRPCARQRPICSTCQDAGDACEGFQTRLVWEGSDLPSRRGDDSRRRHGLDRRPKATPNSKSQTLDARAVVKPPPSKKPAREFAFVSSWPPKPRKKHSRQKTEALAESSSTAIKIEDQTPRSQGPASDGPDTDNSPPSNSEAEGSQSSSKKNSSVFPQAVSGRHPPQQYDENRSFDAWLITQSGDDEALPLLTRHVTSGSAIMNDAHQSNSAQQYQRYTYTGENDTVAYVEQQNTFISQNYSTELVPRRHQDNSMARSTTTLRMQYFTPMHVHYANSIAPPVRYATTADQFSLLLDRYDQEFCTYPITSDLDINPFRYRRETSMGSKHLLHAIIALACHYRNEYPKGHSPPVEFHQHKNQALSLYTAALTTTDIQTKSLSALDTLLALWCIDTVESANNRWRVYLTQAYNLLEMSGGINVWALSFRSQAAVTMLLWWDAVVALLSRRVCIMPYAYFEAVRQWESSGFWTFFDLIGCPREVFVALMQFAHLAGQVDSRGRVRETMKAIVAGIEANLRNYRTPDLEALSATFDEESLQQTQDQNHCCEAFRYSLLIYGLRVFHDNGVGAISSQVRARLRYLSRACLDHVASVRLSSDTLKQLTLTIFLAGAETNDERHKDLIRAYCERWFQTFGYDMFPSVISILEEVWASQEAPEEELWWGDVIDARRQRAGGGDFDFCFG